LLAAGEDEGWRQCIPSISGNEDDHCVGFNLHTITAVARLNNKPALATT
jgi:hypothetical protein